MFTTEQKREISDKIQSLLRETNDPKLPTGEITFTISVRSADAQSFGTIQNNGAVTAE